MNAYTATASMSASTHMSIAASLHDAATRFGNGGSDTPRLDAEVLLAHVIGKSRNHLRTWPEQVLPEAHYVRFLQLIARRAAGEPVAYIIGRREFWSLSLAVNAHTLIPRPETERLVELALERIAIDHAMRIADIGTGSGAIALAIASERPRCRIIATDISPQALALAEDNAQRLNIRNVEFRLGDGLVPLCAEHLDMICSNPPYIAEGDPHLLHGDLPAEPRAALVSGETGLEMIDALARGAKQALHEGGWLLLEHGYDQGTAVAALLTSLGYREVAGYRDHAGHPRVTLGKN